MGLPFFLQPNQTQFNFIWIELSRLSVWAIKIVTSLNFEFFKENPQAKEKKVRDNFKIQCS